MREATARRLLVTVFGEDWELRLMAAGVVEGTCADEDRERVVELGRLELGDEELAELAGDAWLTVWRAGVEGTDDLGRHAD